jgi:hypothetical protein
MEKAHLEIESAATQLELLIRPQARKVVFPAAQTSQMVEEEYAQAV